MNVQEKKYNGIDFMKVIMAIFVIAIHTHPLESIQGTIYHQIYTVLVGIAVPFFFISSGYLVFKKMKGEFNDKENIDILKKYIIKIIKLYITWNIIYLPLAVYGYIQDEKSILESVLLYIRGTFLIGEHYYSWILWYLLSTIYSCMALAVLLKCKWKDWQILICSLIVFIISNVITYIAQELETTNYVLNLFIKIIKYTIANGRILLGFTYISIGMYLSRNEKHINLTKLICLTIVSYVCAVIFNNPIINLILCILFFCMTCSIKLKDRKIYYYFRKISTTLYFLHMWIFFIYSILVGMENRYGLEGFIVTTIVSLVFSIIIICIQKKK